MCGILVLTPNKWRTALVTCDINGNEMFLLSDFAMASHYHWRDDKVLAIYSEGKEIGSGGAQLYELIDETYDGRIIDASFFAFDGHNSYSPNLQWMLYDSYPKADQHRELYLYHLGKKTGALLGRFFVLHVSSGDIRCDLHPVWAPNGRTISFDSVHEGYRGIYLVNLDDAFEQMHISQY